MNTRNHHTTGRIPVAMDASFVHFPYSGIGTYVRSLSAALRRDADALGIDLQLIEPAPGRVLRPGTRQHRMAWDAIGVTPATRRQGDRPAVLHLPQMSAPLIAPAPLVVTIHDAIPFILPEYRASAAMRVYLGVMARSVRRAKRVIAVSHAAAADISTALGIPDERVVVIPEAADPLLTPDVSGDAAHRVRDRWGITGRYVFNVGGYDVRKQLPLLVEAFASALPELPDDASLVIAGAPHSNNERMFPPLGPVIRRHGLEHRVRELGRVTDAEKRDLLQASWVHATPSLYEGFGLPPLESMTCGVPAIVADRTSLPEVVGDAGVTVEPTVDDFARAIVRIYTDVDERDRLADASLERSHAFSWASAARETARVYCEVAGVE